MSGRHEVGLTGELPIVVRLCLGWRNVADGTEQAMVVESGHSFKVCQFHRLPGLPPRTAMDQFGFGHYTGAAQRWRMRARDAR